jgi:DinB family protein
MPDYAIELVDIVDRVTPRLLDISDEGSARRPAPGKWSPREIVGHLVDSASNNHQRFVRAQWQDDLVVQGYAQDGWVAAQRYQDAPWTEIVMLWAHFNRHLARVMEAVPDEIRLRPRHRHNLHQMAWQPVLETEPATLDYFMRDYVGHLKHHVRQILGPEWSA